MTETRCQCKFLLLTRFPNPLAHLKPTEAAGETASNLTPLVPPVSVMESARNYGYNPSSMKTEGLRRPPSKTSMHQSRRLLASAQPHTDVSGRPRHLFHSGSE